MLSTRVESISSLKFFNYWNLGDAGFYSQAYRGITRRNHHTDAYAQEEEIRYQQTEILVMVIKDVDSVMICRAALAQMPKGEKHFANTVLSAVFFFFFLPAEFLILLLSLIHWLSSSQ